MTPLSHLLRAKLAFDRNKSSAYMSSEHEFLASGSDLDAAELENARLQPLFEQLILCVEALEFYADPQSKTFCSGDYEAKADEVLAALAALVEK